MLPDTTDPSSGKTSRTPLRPWFAAAALVWLAGVGAGLWTLWAYDNRPGVARSAPGRWPADTALKRSADGADAGLRRAPAVHVHAGEPRRARRNPGARVVDQPKTYVLFLKPPSVDAGWEQTDLWRTGRCAADVTVLRDDDGVEARRFGVETSGQTLLYDEARHADLQRRHHRLARPRRRERRRTGAGRAARPAAVPNVATASVFGCSLFSRADQRSDDED